MVQSFTKNTQLGQLEGSKFPKLNTLRKDPVAASLMSKLVPEPGTRPGNQRRRDQPPAEGMVRGVSDQTTQNITDIDNIFQLLPDTELAMQILVSSILSPKDMVTVELGYKVNPDIMNSEVGGALIEVIKRYFENTYKIKTLLPKILEDCLFKKGSYPLLVLPESSIDDIVNNDSRVSLESLRGELDSNQQPIRSIGLLGSARSNKSVWSMESFTGKTARVPEAECKISFNNRVAKKLKGELTVSDNLNTLKFPKVIEKMRQERIQDALGTTSIGLEARRNRRRERVTDDEFAEQIYPNREYEKKQYVSVNRAKDLSRPTKGHPVVMKLPPEAVIPVHVPSNPEDHVGYFVLLDQFGNPLNRVKEADYYKELSTNMQNGNLTSQLMEAGRRASEGQGSIGTGSNTESETVRLYADMVERDLIARLKNGVYGDGVEISRPTDVYRVMLARSLASMGTQILYVPAELITYIAFDYNSNGVGKSLLDDAKILASIRSMLLFSNTMAAIKNSTGKTSVGIELDPDDPDPTSTVEYMVHQYTRNRQANYPLGASNPVDIVDYLQNAGVDIQVSGNSAYPETQLNVEDHSSNKVMVDRDLDEEMRSRYLMNLGLSPETVDMSKDVEFATSIVTSNLLLAKRVIIYQDILLPLLGDHVSKVVENSSILWGELLEVLESNKSSLSPENKKLNPEELVTLFLEGLEVTLPRPDSAKLENQIESFRNYTDALEQAVDAYFGEDAFMLRDFDDVEDTIRTIRAAVIAHYQRQWMRNNNVLPELQEIVLQNAEGDPELDLAKVHGTHMENVGNSIAELIKKLRKDREKREKMLEEKEEPPKPEPKPTPLAPEPEPNPTPEPEEEEEEEPEEDDDGVDPDDPIEET